MRILFVSGKGGAGKTTVTAGIAAHWPRPYVLSDADVEAPDLALFIPHTLPNTSRVALEVPVAIKDNCNGCGDCLDICQFNAIIKLGERIVPFDKMCHSCGGCFEICPKMAIVAGEREVGTVADGTAFDDVPFYEGRSRIGEAMTPPLIRDLMKKAVKRADTLKADLLVDAPPGVSCPVTTAARYSDAVVFVADPTPFGLHDFQLAVEALRQPGGRYAVIINRADQPESRQAQAELEAWCESQNLPVVARLPFDRAAAAAYARREHPMYVSPEWKQRFHDAAQSLMTTFDGASSHA